ncbi:MAG TPA: TIGR03564 family F420-dependent LLM class oxidoreductase [Acidimicrobiales bacterium]|nr:TIGR03564 family F420-dependent LLM class oxidoreductase [Acidimicrobiales bacterium]
MRIGIFMGDLAGASSRVDNAVAAARRIADRGFTSVWMPQIFGLDALTTLAVIGAQVPDIELGTGVVPIYPRHPGALAQQALTVQSASGGRRLSLGIGLSHKLVIEDMFGYSFDRPASFMEEYLQALAPLLRGERTDSATDRLTTHLTLDIAAPGPPGLVVAALGERMIRLAAQYADGTVTWMTGEKTLADHTVPTMRAADGGADKRVVAALPVAVTDDVAAAKERAAQVFAIYGHLPSYRAMLDREGAAGPEDVAFIGSADEVARRITELFDAGVTEFVAVPFSREDESATSEALAALNS